MWSFSDQARVVARWPHTSPARGARSRSSKAVHGWTRHRLQTHALPFEFPNRQIPAMRPGKEGLDSERSRGAGGKTMLWNAVALRFSQRDFKDAPTTAARTGRSTARILDFTSYGEMLPNDGSYIDLDPNRLDKFGLPLARRHLRWGENEEKQTAP
jgi:choline dehydrogenase-like flavoprotein